MATASIISMGITALVMLLGGRIIYNAFSRTGDNIYLWFSLSFLGYGIMHIFLALGAYFSGINSSTAGAMYVVAHVLLFFSISLFLRVPLKLFLPQKEKLIFYIALIFASLASVLLFTDIPAPQATPQGFTAWNIPSRIARVVGTFTTVMLFAGFILFILTGRKTQEKIYKIRAFLLALGVLVFLTAGPAHNFAKNLEAQVFADILTPIGAIIMFGGIYYPYLIQKKLESSSREEEKIKEFKSPQIKW